MSGRPPTYGSYLQLDLLLAAQRPPDYARLAAGAAPSSATRDLIHHDELLFVVVHQAFELWFKLVLHELDRARNVLGRLPPRDVFDRLGRPATVPERDIPEVTACLERVNEIFRVAVDQFRVIETMQPLSFLAFRDAITPASGFQSVQFRELEILAGAEEARAAAASGVFAKLLTPEEHDRVERRLREPTLKETLFDWLSRTPIERAFPRFAEDFAERVADYCDAQARAQVANPFATPEDRASAASRAEDMKRSARSYLFDPDPIVARANRAFLFITTYRAEPLLRHPALLLDRLVEFEQSFRMFRFRHARMVERMIGVRTGTGGSAGVAYLDRTAGYKIFGRLLEARNFLIDRALVPDLPNPEIFRFKFGE